MCPETTLQTTVHRTPRTVDQIYPSSLQLFLSRVCDGQSNTRHGGRYHSSIHPFCGRQNLDPKDNHILTSEAYGSVDWYGDGDFVDMIGLDLERGAYLVWSPMVSKQQLTLAYISL